MKKYFDSIKLQAATELNCSANWTQNKQGLKVGAQLTSSMICFKESDKRDALFVSFKSFQILF